MVDAREWGVEPGYNDALGRWHNASPETIRAILEVMGAHPGHDHEAGVAMTVRLDHELPPVAPGEVRLEDGGTVRVDGRLPDDMPAGYHRLQPDDGEPVELIVSPGRCPAPEQAGWGWAAQLYAARSTKSWGIGDLGDLRRLAEWSVELGARFVLINPLHAATPVKPLEPSPYSASSRVFANPLYLRVEEIPGAGALPGIQRLAEYGRRLNSDRRIDRDQVWALKSSALESLFERFAGDEGFERFSVQRGPALEGFATFCALAERHGGPWQRWPERYRRPGQPAVREFAASAAGRRRVEFHAWLQWHLDRQLAHASAPLDLIQDLAIGVEPGGADAWLWQDTFAPDVRVGAPPDEFNALGQDWGLPPWDPWKLRRAGYAPFIETVRGALRHAGGLRFDHIMGLFRLWWIPPGAGPAEGAYVRYPYWDLLNILALEATRANAFVVGEDLGTVEDAVRCEMAERRIFSYRLLWFERERPERWPAAAMAAVTTHDLPTVAGVWTGADLEAQRHLGLAPRQESATALRDRLEQWTGSSLTSPVEEVIERTYGVLSGARCELRTATLDDAVAVTERPNMPGTVKGWPNWSIGLPVSLEDLERSPLALHIAARLERGRSGA